MHSKPKWLQWLPRLFAPHRAPRRMYPNRPTQGPIRMDETVDLFGAAFPGTGLFQDTGERPEQMRRQMQKQARFFRRLALAWTICGLSCLLFVCWCVYHVLRSKGPCALDASWVRLSMSLTA